MNTKKRRRNDREQAEETTRTSTDWKAYGSSSFLHASEKENTPKWRKTHVRKHNDYQYKEPQASKQTQTNKSDIISLWKDTTFRQAPERWEKTGMGMEFGFSLQTP